MQKRAKARREKYQGDSPFAADKKPDKIEKREDRWSPGMQGGYRAGWAQPMGNIRKGYRFTEELTGMIFLWGDGGYQFIPQLTLGIYLAGGYVIPDCDGDASCTVWDFRAGCKRSGDSGHSLTSRRVGSAAAGNCLGFAIQRSAEVSNTTTGRSCSSLGPVDVGADRAPTHRCSCLLVRAIHQQRGRAAMIRATSSACPTLTTGSSSARAAA
jgi:hypothetical protein